jgi:hypothetical protein
MAGGPARRAADPAGEAPRTVIARIAAFVESSRLPTLGAFVYPAFGVRA